MIFPGMDPYLEEPQLSTGVHGRLIVYIADYLQPSLRPRFIAAVEERVYLEGPAREIFPDVWIRHRKRSGDSNGAVALAQPDTPVVVQVPAAEVHQRYVTILDKLSGQKIVTVIEVVSPTNKYPGAGRDSYVQKQTEVRQSDANLVEIDLLRTGNHVLAMPEVYARGEGEYDYLVAVNRAQKLRDQYELYLCSLRRPLPKIRIPLVADVPDVTLDLQAVVTQLYEQGEYQDRFDYTSPCRPPLARTDRSWANKLVKAARQKKVNKSSRKK